MNYLVKPFMLIIFSSTGEFHMDLLFQLHILTSIAVLIIIMHSWTSDYQCYS